MAYLVEQQRLDKATLDRTIGMLSARIIGERQEECEENVLDYIADIVTVSLAPWYGCGQRACLSYS